MWEDLELVVYFCDLKGCVGVGEGRGFFGVVLFSSLFFYISFKGVRVGIGMKGVFFYCVWLEE